MKKIWKYLATGLVILCIGILIGILIGMPIGETRGRRAAEEAYKRQEQEVPDVTDGVKPTETPEEDKPTDAPGGELQPTTTVSPTSG